MIEFIFRSRAKNWRRAWDTSSKHCWTNGTRTSITSILHCCTVTCLCDWKKYWRFTVSSLEWTWASSNDCLWFIDQSWIFSNRRRSFIWRRLHVFMVVLCRKTTLTTERICREMFFKSKPNRLYFLFINRRFEVNSHWTTWFNKCKQTSIDSKSYRTIWIAHQHRTLSTSWFLCIQWISWKCPNSWLKNRGLCRLCIIQFNEYRRCTNEYAHEICCCNSNFVFWSDQRNSFSLSNIQTIIQHPNSKDFNRFGSSSVIVSVSNTKFKRSKFGWQTIEQCRSKLQGRRWKSSVACNHGRRLSIEFKRCQKKNDESNVTNHERCEWNCCTMKLLIFSFCCSLFSFRILEHWTLHPVLELHQLTMNLFRSINFIQRNQIKKQRQKCHHQFLQNHRIFLIQEYRRSSKVSAIFLIVSICQVLREQYWLIQVTNCIQNYPLIVSCDKCVVFQEIR